MSQILLGEYRNINSKRLYPFADTATLKDTNNISIPEDFLVDAFLYPIDLENSIYLSKIDLTEQLIYFSDTVTNKLYGLARFNINSSVVYVIDNQIYNRTIGVLVFGSGLKELYTGETTRIFLPDATEFCPSAFMAMNQTGVRGFLLPDGSFMSGDVLLKGEDGVIIETSQYDGYGMLYISMEGVLPPSDSDCIDTNYIRTICIEQVKGGFFSVAKYNTNSISINAANVNLDEICRVQKQYKLPDASGYLPLDIKDGEGPCTSITEPTHPFITVVSMVTCWDVSSMRGALNIVAPPVVGSVNPVGIDALPGIGAANNKLTISAASFKQIQSDVESFIDPIRPADGIKVYVKGLADYRRHNK